MPRSMRSPTPLFHCTLLASLALVACAKQSPTPSPSSTPTPDTALPIERRDATAPAPDAASGEHARTADASAPARPSGPLNVIVVTVDSLRGDVFFPRGETPWIAAEPDVAPNLHALMKRAVVYSRAYALSSYTSMSVGAFLAGRYPGEIKRSGFFFGSYPSDVVMFPERLHDAGVHTLGAQAHFYFRGDGAGLDQGFDVWKMVDGIKKNNLTDEDVTGDKHEALAERILSNTANTDGRFFAWFHFMDPHDVYHRHDDDGIKYGNSQRDRYLGEITYADRQLGKLFAFINAQPWAAHTVIILSADHGESFGEHGHYRHGFQLWQQLVHVPLFFVLPGATPRVIATPRSHIDLAPTIMELLGVPAAPVGDLKGTSLVAELYGETAPSPRDIWIDLPRTSDNDRRRALIHDGLKLIAYGDDHRFDVYDLTTDPDELHPLGEADKARRDSMIRQYRDGQAGIVNTHVTQARSLVGAPDGRGW